MPLKLWVSLDCSYEGCHSRYVITTYLIILQSLQLFFQPDLIILPLPPLSSASPSPLTPICLTTRGFVAAFQTILITLCTKSIINLTSGSGVQGRGGCEGAARPAAGGAAQQGRPALLLPVRGACACSRQRLLLGEAAPGAAPAGHRLLGVAAAAAGQ